MLGQLFNREVALSRPGRARSFGRSFIIAAVLLAAAGCKDAATSPGGGPPPPPPLPPPPPPPALKAFDLRFKGVGVLWSTVDEVHSDVNAHLQLVYKGGAGSPLSLGASDCSATECAWGFDVFALPTGVAPVATQYIANGISSLSTYLDTAATDTVIQSLDLEPGPGLLGISRIVTSKDGGYHLTSHRVPLANFAAAATQEGLQNRVITALSSDSGQVLYVSYAWDLDSTPAGYDAQVATASSSTAAAVADTLALGGYTITAVGADSADGLVFVGTKRHGATARRGLLSMSFPTDTSGYAPVAYFFTGPTTATILFEN